MVRCSGDYSIAEGSSPEDTITFFEKNKHYWIQALVVHEYSESKGEHVHYLLDTDDSFGTGTANNIRTKLRSLIREMSKTKTTCVDPDSRTGNTWEKARNYLCKGYIGKTKDDPVKVLFRTGVEFATEAQISDYHDCYYSIKNASKREKARETKNRMEIMWDEFAEVQLRANNDGKNLTGNDVLELVVSLYEKHGWLLQKHMLLAQVRTLALAINDDGQTKQHFLNSCRSDLQDILA